jgi:acetyl esterase
MEAVPLSAGSWAPARAALRAADPRMASLVDADPTLDPDAVLDGWPTDLWDALVFNVPIDEEWVTVPAEVGSGRLRLIKPPGAEGILPVILYLHGGGWVLGNAGTHDRLVRELAVGSNAALAFVEYPNSPEARYPVAIEQAYATAQWVVREGAGRGLDGTRIAVAGDSVGGNMAAVLTLLAKDRGDVHFAHAQMYYPVTDAAMDTESYEQYADGPYLTRKANATRAAIAQAIAFFREAFEPAVVAR